MSELSVQLKKEEQVVETILQERMDRVQEVYQKYLPGIICWGDSLTAGAGGGGTTYPKVIGGLIEGKITSKFDIHKLNNSAKWIVGAKLKPVEVVNMGVGGENTLTICGRNGSIPFVTSKNMTIPADCEQVSIYMMSLDGRGVAPLRQGNVGMDYVVINGIEGKITIEQESYTSKDYSYTFTRKEAGEVVNVPAGTEIITSGSENYLNYIPVIFIGTNGGYRNYEELIKQQRGIIEHQAGNPKGRFIIIGLHHGNVENLLELESVMEAEYGEQYINWREYLCTEALADAGMKATNEDRIAIGQGKTPPSLLVDDVHFSAVGYELLGNLILERMDKLGYFEEVNTAIDEAMAPIEE